MLCVIHFLCQELSVRWGINICKHLEFDLDSSPKWRAFTNGKDVVVLESSRVPLSGEKCCLNMLGNCLADGSTKSGCDTLVVLHLNKDSPWIYCALCYWQKQASLHIQDTALCWWDYLFAPFHYVWIWWTYKLKKVIINSHSKIYIISHTLRHLSQIGHGKQMSEKAGPCRTTAECSSCSLSEMLHCWLIFHESMQSIHEMQS